MAAWKCTDDTSSTDLERGVEVLGRPRRESSASLDLWTDGAGRPLVALVQENALSALVSSWNCCTDCDVLIRAPLQEADVKTGWLAGMRLLAGCALLVATSCQAGGRARPSATTAGPAAG